MGDTEFLDLCGLKDPAFDEYLYLYLRIPVQTFEFALLCQPKYIHMQICPFFNPTIFVFMFAHFVIPNIFVIIFVKKILRQIINLV